MSWLHGLEGGSWRRPGGSGRRGCNTGTGPQRISTVEVGRGVAALVTFEIARGMGGRILPRPKEQIRVHARVIGETACATRLLGDGA